MAACPVCSSGTGRQVRAGLLDGDLGVNVLATVLPFAVLAGVVAGVHFGWPVRGKGGRHGRRRD